MKKVLLCPPTHYKIAYEINPWMHIDNQVNPEKAMEEYRRLKQIYQDLGLEILEIEQGENLPDMVYAANFGSPHGNFFIKANFKFDERKGESELAKQYIQKLGFAIKELPENIYFEGQGDLLKAGNKILMGWGKRTDFEAKKYLEEFLQTEIIDLKLIDQYYYHLDTCFFPLDENTVALNPLSFEEEDLIKISKYFSQIIEVEKEDNDIIACNGVVAGKTAVCGKGISEQLRNDYKKYGFDIIETPMDEFRKGGGSVKCLTLEFY